ncbi:hypothetical protein CFC21_102544 [Triticum aestivum]|uniref:Stomagen C-terminal domain-containing protein n=4 Tax=Triticum TaxID=4564 RepID=A0A9R1A1D1_TRITD|nr:uncharacterized protein LOC123156002 [Triticum aestivum]KAF7101150.1 hypothetical protein CFC21_102544 [Triticum aestivum]VAI86348.1 unnamed protein product [Triticum turgidum subsp. durum]
MTGVGRNRLLLMCYLLLLAMLITGGGGVLAARPFSAWTLETEHQGLTRPEGGPPAAGSWPTALRERSEKRRRLVGSRAPTCTYNECRGCRHRCSARGVPVDATDPMNSAYHYRCFCHI